MSASFGRSPRPSPQWPLRCLRFALWLLVTAAVCAGVLARGRCRRHAGFVPAPAPRQAAPLRRAAVKGAIAGIQPSGNLHIGNYVGCIHPAVQYQNEGGELTFMVADLHAMTGGEPGADLREGTRRTVATLLACGVDPAKANVILQSQFPEILELQWVLGTAISLGRLRKLANFDRRAMAGEGDSVGQCLYPLLMAADVLCSDSETIIAGEDQACHVGLIREVAEKLNHRLEAPVVRVPQWHRHCGFRVLSLDGGDKMSKSNPKASARINLTDDDAAIGSKLRAAKTTTTDPAAPEVANLLRLLRFFSGDSLSSDWGAAGGLQCRALKEELHRALSAHLSPIRARYAELVEDGAALGAALDAGRRRLGPLFSSVVERVKHARKYYVT